MGQTIKVSGMWFPQDISKMCLPWITDSNGDYRRKSCKGMTYSFLAAATNHLQIFNPRPTFNWNLPPSLCDSTGIDPLYEWCYYDGTPSGRWMIMHIIAIPKTAGAASAYARQSSTSSQFYNANHKTGGYTVTVSSVDDFYQIFYDKILVYRGSSNDAEIVDAIETANGYKILSMNVQEAIPADGLFTMSASVDLTAYPNCCNPTLSKRLDKVKDNTLEDIASNFATLRQNNLPIVINWASVGTTSTPGTSDETALTIASQSSYVNVLDQSVSARTADTPGPSCDLQHAGIGHKTSAKGHSVKITCRVLANAPTNDGYIKFEGPNHVSNNNTEITVTGGGGLGWYGSSSNYILGNSNAEPGDTTAARNKFDIFGKCTGANLYIYGLRAWVEYDPFY